MNIDKNLFLTDYISEAREILDSLDDSAIQAAKVKRNTKELPEILRQLHTLKGSSRMMEYVQIEKIVNHLETVFKNIQSNQTEIPNKIIQLLLGVSTVLHSTIDSIENGGDGTVEQYEEILKNIDNALEDADFVADFSKKGKKKTKDNSEAKNADENSEFFHDTQTIKVQIPQIDSILQMLDKLIMRQIKLKNEIDELNKKSGMTEFQAFQELSENITVLENQSVDIQKNIISLRMLPFDMILRPIKRSIVAEALKAEKNIEFDIPQSEITIDKFILEKLPIVLIHLVRNAIDHGIETKEERKKLGKPEKGIISVSVSQVSNRIFVNVKDDGRGIDYEKIRQKALKLFQGQPSKIKASQSFYSLFSVRAFLQRTNSPSFLAAELDSMLYVQKWINSREKSRLQASLIKELILSFHFLLLLQLRTDFLLLFLIILILFFLTTSGKL